ncbi:MAG: GHKL domain-containing protein [bacterium]|nr:GHKL domain-containing protein [bacterium]
MILSAQLAWLDQSLDTNALLALAVLSLCAALAKTSFPKCGTFSLAAAIWIFTAGFSPAWAAIIAVASIATAHFARQGRLADSLSELCAAGAMLAVFSLPRLFPETFPGYAPIIILSFLACLAYAIISLILPGLAAKNIAPEDFRPNIAMLLLYLSVPALGLCGQICFPLIASGIASGNTSAEKALLNNATFNPLITGSAISVCLLVLAIAIAKSANIACEIIKIEESSRLKKRLKTSASKLKEAQLEKNRTDTELLQKIDELTLLELLSRTLAGTEIADACRLTANLLMRLMPLETCAIFAVADKGSLEPIFWKSPHDKTFASWNLLNCQEKIAELAATGRELTGEYAGSLPEICKAAVPIGNHGVLYAGRNKPGEFTVKELNILRIAANAAESAWQPAQMLEMRRHAISKLETDNTELAEKSSKLEVIASSMGELMAQETAEDLLEALEHLVRRLADADHVSLLIAEKRLQSEVTVPGSNDNEHPQIRALLELAEAACINKVALLIDDISQTRFAPPDPKTKSVIAIPFPRTEVNSNDAIIVESNRADAFTRQDRDLLTMLAYQAAQILRGNELRRRLAETLDDLRHSQAATIQSSKLAAVGQLAAGVAHELNTPLGTIMLGIDSAIAAAGEESKASKRLAIAKKAAAQAKEIVAKLLHYSRPAGTCGQEVSLRAVAEDTLVFIEHHLKTGNINVELDLHDVPSIKGNPNELQQAITNLMLNARDALMETSDDRRIKLSCQEIDEKSEIIVSVEDNGPGISAAALEHIFEPFYTTKPVGKGTGLGLSVTREIAQKHGGRLSCSSRPGCTRFELALPFSWS